MSFQVKRVGWRMAMGLLGLAVAPLGARASDLDAASYHINLGVFAAVLDSPDGGGALSIVPTRLVPTYANVTAPRISGIDLFSNQAVFSFGGVSYLENSPVSGYHANSDEANFWASTVITNAASITIGMPSEGQESMLGQMSSHTSYDDLELGLNGNATPASLSKKMTDTSLDIQSLPGMRMLANGTSDAAVATSSKTSDSQLGVADPVLSRDLVAVLPGSGDGAVSATPEPASICLLGVCAVGLLARRRVTC